jgi:hypothetical protein
MLVANRRPSRDQSKLWIHPLSVSYLAGNSGTARQAASGSAATELQARDSATEQTGIDPRYLEAREFRESGQQDTKTLLARHASDVDTAIHLLIEFGEKLDALEGAVAPDLFASPVHAEVRHDGHQPGFEACRAVLAEADQLAEAVAAQRTADMNKALAGTVVVDTLASYHVHDQQRVPRQKLSPRSVDPPR